MTSLEIVKDFFSRNSGNGYSVAYICRLLRLAGTPLSERSIKRAASQIPGMVKIENVRPNVWTLREPRNAVSAVTLRKLRERKRNAKK